MAITRAQQRDGDTTAPSTAITSVPNQDEATIVSASIEDIPYYDLPPTGAAGGGDPPIGSLRQVALPTQADADKMMAAAQELIAMAQAIRGTPFVQSAGLDGAGPSNPPPHLFSEGVTTGIVLERPAGGASGTANPSTPPVTGAPGAGRTAAPPVRNLGVSPLNGLTSPGSTVVPPRNGIATIHDPEVICLGSGAGGSNAGVRVPVNPQPPINEVPRQTEDGVFHRARSTSPRRHDKRRSRRRSRSKSSSESDYSRSPRRARRASKRTSGLPSPFADWILDAELSGKFKVPASLDKFDGATDPDDHVQHYRNMMDLQGASEVVLCRAFSTTLKKTALDWFNNLGEGSIYSFKALTKKFCHQFMASGKTKRAKHMLFDIRQRPDETVRSYMKRFNDEKLTIARCDDETIVLAFSKGLQESSLKEKLARKEPRTLRELYDQANGYMKAYEWIARDRQTTPAEQQKAERRRDRAPEGGDQRRGDGRPPAAWQRGPIGTVAQRGPNAPPAMRGQVTYGNQAPPPMQPQCPPMIVPMETVMTVAINEGLLREKPRNMTQPERYQTCPRYCKYHKERGHTTEECKQLKTDIARLIAAGHLGQYVAQGAGQPAQIPQPAQTAVVETMVVTPPTPVNSYSINAITGGPAIGGGSKSSRKRYAREVLAVGKEPAVQDEDPLVISFSRADLAGVATPHNDSILVTVEIGKYSIRRALIDTGSSCDILLLSVFLRMKLGRELLQPCPEVTGFSGSTVKVEGSCVLPVTLGQAPCQVTVPTRFVVIDIQGAYNIIIGRPLMAAIGAVPSVLHQVMKFQTPGGVGQVRSDQQASRLTYDYFATFKKMKI